MSSHGKYVQAEIDGTANANAKYRGSLETFKVEEAGNNKVAFAAIHKNKYLVVKDGKDLSASSWKTPQKTEEFLVEAHCGVLNTRAYPDQEISTDKWVSTRQP